MDTQHGRNVVAALWVLGMFGSPLWFGSVSAAPIEEKTKDIVVTASRTEQEVKASPAAVEVISRDQLDALGANKLSEALAMATNLNITQSAMGNSVSLRGMNNNQTLLLVDGRRIRTEDTNDSANKYEFDRVNMGDVERIEIVRGAASALYGSDAMGGVINIITKQLKEPSITVGADWTTRESGTHVHVGTGQHGKWSFDIDGAYTRTRNWGTLGTTAQSIPLGPMGTYTMDTATTNLYGDRYFFGINGRYEIDKNRELNVFADYMKEDLQSKSSTVHRLRSPRFNRTMVTAGFLNDFDHERWTLGAGYKAKYGRGDYEFRAYHTSFLKDQKVVYTSYSGRNHRPGDVSNEDHMRFDSTTIDGRTTVQLNDRHLLTVGGEYRWEDYASNRLVADSSMKYAALYLQDEWTVTDKWLLIPSLRWDYNDVFGSKMTAKLGTTYHVRKDLRLKANVGSAYRAPTASELYMDWSHSGFAHIIGNRDLRPETSLNFDIGIEAERGKTTGKVTYFRNRVKDMIDHEFIGANRGLYTYRYTNVDRALIQGVETELSHAFTDTVSLRGSYTYLDAKNSNTGERLANRARNIVKLMLTYDDETRNGISASLWQEWLLDYHYELGQEQGNTSFNTTNFVVNKKFNDTFSVYLGVDNIFDHKDTHLFEVGRVYRGGVKVKF